VVEIHSWRSLLTRGRRYPAVENSGSSSPSSVNASRSGCRAPRVNTMPMHRLAANDDRTSSHVATTPSSDSLSLPATDSLAGANLWSRAHTQRSQRTAKVLRYSYEFLRRTGLPRCVMKPHTTAHALPNADSNLNCRISV
jgi:hypothetical protein